MNGPLPDVKLSDLSSFSLSQLAVLYEALHAASEVLVGAEHDPRLDQPENGLLGKQAEVLDNLADYIARQRDAVVDAMEARPKPADSFEASVWAEVIVGHEFACNGTSEVPALVGIAEGVQRRNQRARNQ